jgi:hypothetical protein
MIMWIPQLMSCGIHMEGKILALTPRYARGAAYQPAPGPHGHHAPLVSTALGYPVSRQWAPDVKSAGAPWR